MREAEDILSICRGALIVGGGECLDDNMVSLHGGRIKVKIDDVRFCEHARREHFLQTVHSGPCVILGIHQALHISRHPHVMDTYQCKAELGKFEEQHASSLVKD